MLKVFDGEKNDIDDQIKANEAKGPTIALERSNKNGDILGFKIINKGDIWQAFHKDESFISILKYLYSYYFVLKIPYPLKSEIILGFFHESLEIKLPVQFEKRRTATYNDNVIKLRNKLNNE